MFRMTDTNSKVLMRRRDGRMLAGVCAGIADYLGLDVSLVRAIWAVVAVFTGGAGALAYLAAWIIIPGEGQKSSIAENLATKKNSDAWSG
jgi:phage shock protein C